VNKKSLVILSTILFLLLFPSLLKAAEEAQGNQNTDTGYQDVDKMSLQELSSELTNPLSRLWRVDFENDTIYNKGDIGKTVWTNTLTFRPMLPVSIGSKWVLGIQPQIPFVDTQPRFEESILRELSVTHTTGVGDTILAMVLGREVYKNIEMSLGPTFIFPTATDKVLGQGKWQAGPAALIFYNSKKWTVGAIPQIWWSFAGDSDREKTNQMEIEYVIARHFKGGWNIRSRPTITADFEADSGDKWNVPVGGGIGKLFRLFKVPILFTVEGHYSVIRQDTFGAEWTIVTDLTVVIPNPQAIRKAKKQLSNKHPMNIP